MTHRLPRLLSLVAALVTVIVACDAAVVPVVSDPGADVTQDGAASTPDAAADAVGPAADGGADAAQDVDPVDVEPASVQVRRARPWAGGGLQLVVTTAADLADAPITVTGDDGAAAPEVVTAAAQPGYGLTAIVVRPDPAPTVHGARVAAARHVLESLPAGERVGVWLAVPGGLALQADLTRDIAHAVARLEAIGPGTVSSPGGAPLQGLEAALAEVSSAWDTPHRHLLTVGFDAPGGGPAVLRAAVEASPDGAADAVSAILSARDATRLVGVCGLGGDAGSVEVGGHVAGFELPPDDPHVHALPCDPAVAAADDYPFGTSIAVDLDPAQQAVYDSRHEDNSDLDWTADVRIGDSGPLSASIHFRGKGSLKCARKSMNVNLDGPEARRWGPGAASDEALFISMCLDAGYFNQVLANQLLVDEGAFHLDSRLVTMEIGGEPQGAYLVLEKAADTLIGDRLGVAGVIRRRLDWNQDEDIKHPSDPTAAEAVLGDYHGLADAVDDQEGAALEAELDARLDLDAYLRWVAFHTYMRNGDWTDEVYFFGSAEAGGPLYWRVQGWDADDLWSDCHYGGGHALKDPWSIAYCAEADLDLALLASDEVYARFIDHLEALMNERMTIPVLQATLDLVLEELVAVLDEPGHCLAMVEAIEDEPDIASCADLHAWIQAEMDAFIAKIIDRREGLLAEVAAYHAGELP